MKKCPYCAEQIQDEAIKCKHCGSLIKDGRDVKEIEIFKDEKCTVTSSRVILQGKSYPVANITSIEEIPVKGRPVFLGILMILAGIFLGYTLFALGDKMNAGTFWYILCAGLLFFGVVSVLPRGETAILVLTTSDSGRKTYVDSLEYVQYLAKSINKAVGLK